MSSEGVHFAESATVIKYNNKEDNSSMDTNKNDGIKWTSKIRIEKYNSDESYNKGVPDEITNVNGNTALYNGLALLWRLINGKGESDPDNNFYFNATNTYIGVGNSSATAAATQTGLLGTSIYYNAMDQTTGIEYPIIADNVMTVRAKFGPTEANFTWNEWGILNGDPNNLGSRSPETVVQLNRKVEAMGTKVSGATWVMVADISINP